MKELIGKISIGLILTFLIFQLGFQVERHQFFPLIFCYGLFFLAYLEIVHYTKTFKTVYFFLCLSIFLRLLLLFALPNLSDDIYRFIWDGRLINQGINPFDHLPTYYIEQNQQISGITTDLYNQLNSPNYFTIYPPVNQFIFWLATFIFPDSIWGSSLVMKSCLFAFDVGSIYLIVKLLRHFQLPIKNALLYALNPLIILEITGNLHFEGAMIFFLLLAIWLIAVKEKWVWSAIAFALSVASKLLPLMFLPFFIRRVGHPSNLLNLQDLVNFIKKNNGSISRFAKFLKFNKSDWIVINWKKTIIYFTILGSTLLFLFIPLINGVFLANFGESLNLYFQKFEFNGSFYYFFRWVGYQVKGYNIIGTLGPVLALTAFCSIILLTFFEKKSNWETLFERLLFAICIYLFCSVTVHPWYVAMPVVFCVFTRFRFPILWSGLVFLTYVNYSYAPYWENLWVVGIEYLFVFGYLIYELKAMLPSPKSDHV